MEKIVKAQPALSDAELWFDNGRDRTDAHHCICAGWNLVNAPPQRWIYGFDTTDSIDLAAVFVVLVYNTHIIVTYFCGKTIEKPTESYWTFDRCCMQQLS